MRLMILAAFAMLSLAACQPAADTGDAGAAEVAASQDVHAFQIGELQAWALRDGGITLPVDSEALPWSDRAAIARTLEAAGDPVDAVNLSIQPLLVRDGDRLVLIDAGAGGQMDTQNLLVSSLVAAGFQPGDITDILISHAHGDHIGGLVDAGGGLVFPNAVIRMSAPEWADLTATAEQAGAGALVEAITPRVETFEPGSQITASITAMPLAGHTPGHSGYEIVSGEERLLYIGDAMHSAILSVRHPDWVSAWDTDSDAAVGSRVGLLEMGADHSLMIYGVHFPYPGLGRFQREGGGFIWVPEAR
jgi:glyoxylase-like metal-dependent hydrolase (beta-lactamase superfamily II)